MVEEYVKYNIYQDVRKRTNWFLSLSRNGKAKVIIVVGIGFFVISIILNSILPKPVPVTYNKTEEYIHSVMLAGFILGYFITLVGATMFSTIGKCPKCKEKL